MTSLWGRAAVALALAATTLLVPIAGTPSASASSLCVNEEVNHQASIDWRRYVSAQRRDFRSQTLVPARTGLTEARSALGLARDHRASANSTFVAARQTYRDDPNPSTSAALATAREQRDQTRATQSQAAQTYRSAVATRAQAETDYDHLNQLVHDAVAAVPLHLGLLTACQNLTGVGVKTDGDEVWQVNDYLLGDVVIYGLEPNTQYFASPVESCNDYGTAGPGRACIIIGTTDSDGHWHLTRRYLGTCGITESEFLLYQGQQDLGSVTLPVDYPCHF